MVLGPEIVVNGDFSSATGWTLGADGAITGGQLVVTGSTTGTIADNTGSAIVAGRTYEVTFTIVSISVAVSMSASMGGTAGTARNAPGTYTEKIVPAGSGTPLLTKRFNGNFAGVIDNYSVKLLPGLHLFQATAGQRPNLKLDGGIYSDLYVAASSQGLATAAFSTGTFTNNMVVHAAIKRTAGGDTIPFSMNSGTGFFGYMASGSASAATGAAAGTPTYLVDRVPVTGGAAVTAGSLHTAVTAGAWHILRVSGLDLSAWTAFRLSLYTAQMFGGNIGGVIACPYVSERRCDQNDRWLGREVGLYL